MNKPEMHSLLSKIVAAALVGLCSWIGYNTAATREDVATLKARMESTAENVRRVDAAHAKQADDLQSLRERVAVLEKR